LSWEERCIKLLERFKVVLLEKSDFRPIPRLENGGELMFKRTVFLVLALIIGLAMAAPVLAGVNTANGWYEGEEIYYIDRGLEEGVTELGENQIYLIGGNRVYQAQVVLFIPGEAGYTPHWNVNVVHTADGITIDDILASPYASEHYPDALFDDVEDILGAEEYGLVKIDHPGLVVLCPIISEPGADAPGNNALPEVFTPWPETF
jgi:hypothetical protein